ncbi:hypothetical protein [Planktothrix sp.]|uniref:hypothetical protein n=1 Tax=Planktothrix sp. TaxID=3088171 RepID=UPI0038D436EE
MVNLTISSALWITTGTLGMIWGLSQPFPSPNKFYGFGMGAIAASIGCYLSYPAMKRTERTIIRQDTADQIFDIGEAATIERYKQAVFPVPRMPDLNIHNHILGMMPGDEQETLEFYNWDDLKHEANAIIVGGNPGSGKSTIVGGFIAPMISRLSESEVIVCDPDANSNRWSEYGYTRIVSDYKAIYQTLIAVSEEKENRKSTGKKHQIILIMDELNDCQGAWRSMYNRAEYNQAIEAIRTLGNARKYNITPIILMQSHNVEDIGLSRKYRNQFAVILCCASARDEVMNIWKQQDERWQWVNTNPYPCVLVGSIPTQIAQHPTHGHHTQFKKVGNAPSNILSPVCSDIQSIPDFQNVETETAYRSSPTQPSEPPKTSPSNPSFDIRKLEKKPENNSNPNDINRRKFEAIASYCQRKGTTTVRKIQQGKLLSDDYKLDSSFIKYALDMLSDQGLISLDKSSEDWIVCWVVG